MGHGLRREFRLARSWRVRGPRNPHPHARGHHDELRASARTGTAGQTSERKVRRFSATALTLSTSSCSSFSNAPRASRYCLVSLVSGHEKCRVRRDRQSACRSASQRGQRNGDGRRSSWCPGRVSVSGRLPLPRRHRRHAMAGHARLYEAGRRNLSFLGDRDDGKPRRYRVAVLESYGLHTEGSARHSHPAAKVQI